jgi:hypothetical protein
MPMFASRPQAEFLLRPFEWLVRLYMIGTGSLRGVVAGSINAALYDD